MAHFSAVHVNRSFQNYSEEQGCWAASNLPSILSLHSLNAFSRSWQYENTAALMDDFLKMGSSETIGSRDDLLLPSFLPSFHPAAYVNTQSGLLQL